MLFTIIQPKINSFIKKRLYFIEYCIAKFFLNLFRRLSPEYASNVAGTICRIIGPYLPPSKIAYKNLSLIFPELSIKEKNRIVKKVWENLGRTIGEFPHLGKLKQNTPKGAGWEIIGAEHLKAQLLKKGPVLFVSGHIGNWEMLPPVVSYYGLTFSSFFRTASNPYINNLILQLRREILDKNIPMFAKGRKGARQALKHLMQGNHLGILSDQKMNDGIEVKFLGKKAMTSSAVASLALKLQCTIIPGYVERLGPARLRVVVEPPLDYSFSQENPIENVKELTQTINNILEKWIKNRPEQWLWLHKRWPKENYSSHFIKK